MSRKIVQLTSHYDSQYQVDILYALCNDGTVWHRTGSHSPSEPWNQVFDVPQKKLEGWEPEPK